jgi:hypothetical protein
MQPPELLVVPPEFVPLELEEPAPEAPEPEAPELGDPEVEAPDVEAPEADAPEPEVAAPEPEEPEPAAPELDDPAPEEPDGAAPAPVIAELAAPELLPVVPSPVVPLPLLGNEGPRELSELFVPHPCEVTVTTAHNAAVAKTPCIRGRGEPPAMAYRHRLLVVGLRMFRRFRLNYMPRIRCSRETNR